jgi:hypothetical protein
LDQRHHPSLIRVEEFEPLVVTGDLSENDLLMPARLSAGLVELLPDMIPHYAKRLQEQQREPSSLYRLELPFLRTLATPELRHLRSDRERMASLLRGYIDFSLKRLQILK